MTHVSSVGGFPAAFFGGRGDPFKKRILTERTDLKPETLGLTLAEGKMILKGLQVRTRVLNEEWEDVFRRWYPDFRQQQSLSAAA